MSSDTLKLSSLQTILSRASKALLAGCGFAVSALIIAFGLAPNAVEPLGVGFPVPAKIAHMIFILVAFGSGWISWSWIRQANRLLWQLEFENKVEPSNIRACLLGSLLSASPIAIRMLGFVTFFLILISFSRSIMVPILHLEYGVNAFFMFLIGNVLALPYLLISLNSKIRYFNPDKWLYRGWIMSLVAFIESCLTESRDFDDPVENKLLIGSFNRALRRDGLRFYIYIVTKNGYEQSLRQEFIESEPEYCKAHGIS